MQLQNLPKQLPSISNQHKCEEKKKCKYKRLYYNMNLCTLYCLEIDVLHRGHLMRKT